MISHLIDFQSIERRIRSCDCVSFDVFDTLLVRRNVIDPRSVFYHLALHKGYSHRRAIEFMQARGRAEAVCREKARLLKRHSEIRLQDVYELLARYPEISAGDEMTYERRFLTRRAAIERIYRFASSSGKRLYAISDFYLPADYVSETLAANGYVFDRVFVSCEHGGGKYDRRLYRQFLKSEGIEPSRVVHVGDNRESDFDMACQENIHAVHVHKNVELLFMEGALNLGTVSLLHADSSFFSKACLAYLARRLEAAEHFSMARQFGAIYAAPLVFLFARWLEQSMVKDGIRKLYLMARDGFTLAAVIKAAGLEIDHEVLKCSRRALMVPAAKNRMEYWETLFRSSAEQPIAKVIEGLSLDKEAEIKGLASRVGGKAKRFADYSEPERIEFVTRSYRIAREQIEVEWHDLLAHLYESGITQDRCAVVDVGWSLISHRALDGLVGRRIPGYYVGTSASAYDNGAIRGFLFERGGDSAWHHFFENAIELLELPFLATEDQYLRIDGESFVRKDPDAREIYRKSVAEEIRDEVVRFAEEFGRFDFSEEDLVEARETVKRIFLHLGAHPTHKERILLGAIPHDRHIADTGSITVGDHWRVGGHVARAGGQTQALPDLTRKFLATARQDGLAFALRRSVRYLATRRHS